VNRPLQFHLLLLAAGLAATAPAAPSGPAGDRSCATCHADKATAYAGSAHALTTSWPHAGNMKGNFAPGGNTMATSDPNLSFLMEKIGGGHFQTASLVTPVQTMQRRERIDLIVGSGRKAQTYLYWDKDLLLELPVSYWMPTGQWMNSPGYPDGTANFDRGTSDRCLECHATSFTTRQPPRNRFVRDSLVLGISCQKCHGPGGEHVARMQASKRDADLAIVNPTKLPRDRQMDLCSLCHAGVGKPLAPTLSYSAGDTLAKYLAVTPADPAKPVDPHGSQFQTLAQSRCYQQSETLTCLACHDVHQTQRRADAYVQSCLACHQVEACGEFPARQDEIRGKCIDCHMPLQTTAKIVMRLGGERHQPQVRTHRIGIYPTAEDLSALKN
jgi:hypothetical protein